MVYRSRNRSVCSILLKSSFRNPSCSAMRFNQARTPPAAGVLGKPESQLAIRRLGCDFPSGCVPGGSHPEFQFPPLRVPLTQIATLPRGMSHSRSVSREDVTRLLLGVTPPLHLVDDFQKLPADARLALYAESPATVQMGVRLSCRGPSVRKGISHCGLECPALSCCHVGTADVRKDC